MKRIKRTSLFIWRNINELPRYPTYLLNAANRILFLLPFPVVGSLVTFPIVIGIPKHRQAFYYNGKYKAHVLKIQVCCDNKANLFWYSGPHLGRIHDIMLFPRYRPYLAINSALWADKAYCARDQYLLRWITPIKRTRAVRVLSQEQMLYIRVHSFYRVRVEHSIGTIQRFRVLSSVYRGNIMRSNPNVPTESEKAIRIIIHMNFID